MTETIEQFEKRIDEMLIKILGNERAKRYLELKEETKKEEA